MNHELPQGWERCSLEDCVEILDSLRKPINNTERESRISGKTESELFPYYGATGQVGFIDGYIFDGEYVALGEDGVPFFDPLKHKAYLIKGKTWVNNHAHVLKGLLGVDDRFICYQLNQVDYQGYVNGATRLKLTQQNMRKLPLILPPLPEQIRIADMLDRVLARVNAAQSRLDKIPALIKRFRQSVLAAATSGELTREWRDMHNIDPTYVTLGDAGVVIKTGPFGSALHKEEYIHGGIPVINPMHIKDGEIAPSSDMTITESKFDELNAWHLQEGDIVIGRRGEMGRAAEVPKHSGSMLCGTGSMIIRSEPERILPAFLCLVLRSPNAIRYFEGNAIGSTMVNLNQKVIKNLPFHYPSLDEQKEIVRRVESLFALADNVEKQYQDAKARTDRLTQAILAKAFRGELVPQNPDDEPAEALLQHIQQQRAEQATAGKRGKARKVSG